MKRFALPIIALCLLPMGVQAQICNSDNILASTPSQNFVSDIPVTYINSQLPLGSEKLDKTTGLVWQTCSYGQTWNGTTQNCDGLPTKLSWSQALALTDGIWRMPTIKELLSIVDFQCQAPPLNPEIFPNTPASILYQAVSGGSYYGTGYWSSTPNLTPNAEGAPKIGAWVMDLNRGEPHLFSVEQQGLEVVQKHFVRLVRSN